MDDLRLIGQKMLRALGGPIDAHCDPYRFRMDELPAPCPPEPAIDGFYDPAARETLLVVPLHGEVDVEALFYGVCQRRMQGHWINEAPYYRCRFPSEYALANKIRRPRNVYLREDAFEADVNGWLTTVFAPHRLHDTVDQMITAQQATGDQAAVQAATDKIADANLKMARYRAALDAGGDPEEIGKWTADAKAQRLRAEQDLRKATRSASTCPRRSPSISP